jgi:excisionase family DNA binding protein
MKCLVTFLQISASGSDNPDYLTTKQISVNKYSTLPSAIFVRVTNLSSLSNNLKNTINIKNQYKMNEKGREELTMNAVPKAVNYLIEEIAEMRATLDKMEKQLGLGVNKHRPMLIEQAAELLKMKVGTIRRLVNDHEIPHYKREHNIYFFEDELIKWIEGSKVKPIFHSMYFRK